MHRELAQSEGEDIGKGWVYVGRHAGSFKQVGREGFKVKPLDLQED